MSELIDIEIVKSDLLQVIAKKYNISYEFLLEDLNNIRHYKTVKSKYSCDHHFFSRDNEQSFYWAGFIAADGCVHKRSHDSKQLIISLSEKDIAHLQLFKSHINFDGPISSSITRHSLNNPKWHDSNKNTISISSMQIFDDMKRFDIVPAKTHIYTFPQWLADHKLVNHFMRGYVDGDGSFYADSKRGRVCFELRGTYEFLHTYRDVLEAGAGIKSKVHVTTPDSTSKIKYSGKKLMPQIVDFLYRDATIYLERKRQKAYGIV
jgi:hypothetical protein